MPPTSDLQSATSARSDARTADTALVREVLAFALAHARMSRNETTAIPDVPAHVGKGDVRSLPTAELRERLDEILLAKRADVGLELLLRCGLLGALLPELNELESFSEDTRRHKDVWKHTLQVVVQSVARPSVRWAALFHDMGKPRTRSIADDGTVHFLHHAEVGARMFKKLAARERLFESDDELREHIQFLILHHQRAHQYDETWTDSATRRFAREMGEHLEDLFALSRADMTTKRKEKRRRFLFQLKELERRIDELAAEDNKPKALPKGLGEALIREFSLPPSKLVGDIRKELERAVERGELPLQADFQVYLDFVRNDPERFRLPARSG
jgi:poly(A) polymerase